MSNMDSWLIGRLSPVIFLHWRIILISSWCLVRCWYGLTWDANMFRCGEQSITPWKVRSVLHIPRISVMGSVLLEKPLCGRSNWRVFSPPMLVCNGVCQDSILGILLFLFYHPYQHPSRQGLICSPMMLNLQHIIFCHHQSLASTPWRWFLKQAFDVRHS